MGKSKPKGDGPPKRSAKDLAQDDQVMGTNNSSIVSKRSVEKLYYPNEAHFFRYFVKKFQRRSPLINRGYHLRLHVIDVTVRNFLRKDDGKPKVVINLGCGYDVLPWQTWTRYPEHCEGVKFLDIDFPDLMQRKRTTVMATPELRDCLTNLEVAEGSAGGVMLKSDRYAQIGRDLRQLDEIRAAIAELVDIEASSFLFVAEVSITYMENVSADAILQWASGMGQAEFCLLEQILPDGPDHPFAKTMLSHFDKLSTPIKSVHKYQTIQDQRDRFLARGWTSINAWNLWQAWEDDTFLSSDDRRKLNEVEPFDEWEEFALFGSHYCIINADNYTQSDPQEIPVAQAEQQHEEDNDSESSRWKHLQNPKWAYQENPGTKGQRRFGAAMAVSNLQGQDIFANVMGLGPSSRLSSSDLYRKERDVMAVSPSGSAGPSSRMCHTITSLGRVGNLFVGGRTNPTKPLKDCWLYNSIERWEKTHDLPVPLYRHAATGLGKSSFALVAGGKTGPSEIHNGWLLYHPEKGWLECKVNGQKTTPVPIFGASLVCWKGCYPRWEGYLAGGMKDDGLIADQVLHWTLDMEDPENPTISLSPTALSDGSVTDKSLVHRFGAVCVPNRATGEIVTIGGIIKDHLLQYEDEITSWDPTSGRVRPASDMVGLGCPSEPAARRALLVGHSVVHLDTGHVAILGGGATCFSMGTYWNKGPYTLRLPHAKQHAVLQLEYQQTIEILPDTTSNGTPETELQGLSAPTVTFIPEVTLGSATEFEAVLRKAQPVVLKGLDLGSCVERWNLDYLAEKAGPERKVVVHESSTQSMDFNAKNFQYVTKTFAEFADEVKKGGRLYLRALSTEEPADRPANLSEDYPTLSADFVLPQELSFVKDNTFSSVLRVSGPVNMWLHYDVMANVYCQIQGSKRLLLFPPTDVEHLSFAPGASSSSIDVFSKLDSPILGRTHPYEANLGPGDILFIPPLWLHTATPTSHSSIAVNVFFRDLENGYSSGRDVYGNRDLAAYEKGRQDVSRLVKGFEKLPEQARQFYLLRLADELRQKIHS